MTVEKAGAGQYRMAIRNAVRGLWSGALTGPQFSDIMSLAIEGGQRAAFNEGARECGILPDEYTTREEDRIREAIAYEAQWIEGFRDAVESGSKANGGKLSPLFARAEIWIGRYEGLKAAARAMTCADRKLAWRLGRTKKPCGSCLKLNGKVKRASYWYEKGILPRVHGADYLECNGFRCDCTLDPTDEPMSKGPLPRLP